MKLRKFKLYVWYGMTYFDRHGDVRVKIFYKKKCHF